MVIVCHALNTNGNEGTTCQRKLKESPAGFFLQQLGMTEITQHHLFVLTLLLIQTQTIHIKPFCIALNVLSSLLHLGTIRAVHGVQEILVKPVDLLMTRGHTPEIEWILPLSSFLSFTPFLGIAMRERASHTNRTMVQQLFFLFLRLHVQGILILTVKQLDMMQRFDPGAFLFFRNSSCLRSDSSNRFASESLAVTSITGTYSSFASSFVSFSLF